MKVYGFRYGFDGTGLLEFSKAASRVGVSEHARSGLLSVLSFLHAE